jgi:kynurenine formamidase
MTEQKTLGTEARLSFDELSNIEALGLRHAWDVGDDDDDLGTVKRLTPDRVLAAAGLVRRGRVVSLSLPLNEPDPPLFGRQPLRHTIFDVDRNTLDDRLDSFHLQGSSQWDGLRHMRCREYGFYGGVDEKFEPGPGRLGIEHWVAHGMVGRGVLLDLERYRRAVGAPLDALGSESVTVEDLLGCAEHQRTELRPGDILCVRFGWTAAYRRLDAAARATYAASPHHAGLSAGEPMARFLWNSEVAALACDNPAVEVVPGDPQVGSLHRRVLPLLGFALGELFDFEALAELSATDGCHEFLFVAVPLNLPGAIGSPANAIAIR